VSLDPRSYLKNPKSYIFLLIIILLISITYTFWNFVYKSNELSRQLQLVINTELSKAKDELDQNPHLSAEEKQTLKNDWDEIWRHLQANNEFQKVGLEKDLRPAFVGFQAIIERAVTSALLNQLITNSNIYIIAPRMPTPLLIKTQDKDFSELKLSEKTAFAAIRRGGLLDLLANTNTKLYAVYCLKANEEGLNESELEQYNDALGKFPNNLEDMPTLKLTKDEFPIEKSGAIYNLDEGSIMIAINAYQLHNLESNEPHPQKDVAWSIQINNKAVDRVDEIQEFLNINSSQNIVLR
jgi:hypothetical protein